MLFNYQENSALPKIKIRLSGNFELEQLFKSSQVEVIDPEIQEIISVKFNKSIVGSFTVGLLSFEAGSAEDRLGIKNDLLWNIFKTELNIIPANLPILLLFSQLVQGVLVNPIVALGGIDEGDADKLTVPVLRKGILRGRTEPIRRLDLDPVVGRWPINSKFLYLRKEE